MINHATIKIFTPSTNPNSPSQNNSSAMALANNITVINNKALFQKRPHLTNEERMDIINRLKKNESGARIARDYGITKQAVSAIKRRAQLMGDNFTNSHSYLNSFNVSNNSSVNGNNSIKASPISINLSASSSSSPIDNSLVSRQLKQQKMNASVMRQSNLLSGFRSTSNLCLPVNPVAIIKSQMAKQQNSNFLHSSSTQGHESPNGTKLKIDSKRLLLPRLLQGAETYQSYSKTSEDSNNNNTLDLRSAKDESKYNDNKDQQVVDDLQKVNSSDSSSTNNQNDKQQSEDEDEVIFVKEQLPQIDNERIAPQNNKDDVNDDDDDDDDGSSQDYEDTGNDYDPAMVMNFDGYEQVMDEEEENPMGYDEEEDINNNPDMDMFPTIESQVNDAIGPIGDHDNVDEVGENQQVTLDDLNNFDESLLMSD